MRCVKLLKRWMNMFFGKSAFHVEQGRGKCYSKREVKGYYNDLTNKVSDKTILDKKGIPINTTIANVEAYFPITIFQYGLGLYDLYLQENQADYLKKFINIANWAIEKQEENGMWDCMGQLKDKAHETQSAMCQSEGASVLLRAYVETKDTKYYDCASRAIEFMIKDKEEGGTCYYENGRPIFQEYVSSYNLSVLNGWIFSLFGLFDYTRINKEEKYKTILENSLEAMCQNLKNYDRKFWSNYDIKGTIASPSYHDLHIKQLQLLYELFGKEELNQYAKKWEGYQKSPINKLCAMVIKLKQKMLKNKYYDINTSLVK